MSEAEKIIAEALRMEGLDAGGASPHGWRCEHPDRYPDYCQCVPRTATAVAAALRDAGMLTETGWEYTGETGDTRRFTDDLEVVKRWAKRGVYNIRRRTKAVHPGPWSPIPGGEST